MIEAVLATTDADGDCWSVPSPCWLRYRQYSS